MDRQPSLLEQVSSIEFLKKSWKSLNKSNRSSSGLSKISIKDFEDNLDSNLEIISKSLRAKKYKFSPVRAVTIKKSNGIDFRPLRIGEIKDRLVQKALSIKLDELLSEKFNLDNECSFAYRKGKNVRDAINKMIDYYNQGYSIIFEADIEKFFDSVNKSNLLTRIQNELSDSSINELLSTAVKQEIGNARDFSLAVFEKYFSESADGIPQGNALSPLLANIYLSDFDSRITKEQIKMIRYADDFIIMCKTNQEAQSAYAIAKVELEQKLQLKMHALGEPSDIGSKTRIINPQNHKFTFLSIRFDGKRCWVSDKKVQSLLDKIKVITGTDSDVTDSKAGKITYTLLPMLTSLRNTVEGWIAAYHFVDLSSQLIEIDKHIDRSLFVAMDRLGFKIEKKSLQRISFKNKSNEVWALNKQQRLNSGIPICNEIWKRMIPSFPNQKIDSNSINVPHASASAPTEK